VKRPNKRGRPKTKVLVRENDWPQLPPELQTQAGKEVLTPAQAKFLRARAVTAMKAWRCCANRGWAINVMLEKVADSVEQAFEATQSDGGPFLAFAPLAAGGGRVAAQLMIRYAGGQAAEVVLVPLVLGAALAGSVAIPVPKTRAMAEAISQTLRAVATTTRQSVQQGCYDCIIRLMMGQKRPRKAGVWRSGGEENRMALRFPHD